MGPCFYALLIMLTFLGAAILSNRPLCAINVPTTTVLSLTTLPPQGAFIPTRSAAHLRDRDSAAGWQRVLCVLR